MMVAWLLVKIHLIVLLCTSSSSEQLPEFETYSENGITKVCRTRNNDEPCPPDTQIEICEDKWEKVRCVPCASGLRQCDKSTSELPTQCYDPAETCSGDGDNLVKVYNLTNGEGCKIVCVCNEDNGYTGPNPNMCQNTGTPCPVTSSREFSRRCMPCPAGYHNPRDDGLDTCTRQNPNVMYTATTIRPVTEKTTTKQQITTPTTNTDETTTVATNSVNGPVNDNPMERLAGTEESSSGLKSYVWVAVIPVAFLVLVCLGVVFCIWHERNRGRDETKGPRSRTCVFLQCCIQGNFSVNEQPVPTTVLQLEDFQGPRRQPKTEDPEPSIKQEEETDLQEQPEPAQPATTDGNPPEPDQLSGHRTPDEHDERSEGSQGHDRRPHGRGRLRTSGEQPGQNESPGHRSGQGHGRHGDQSRQNGSQEHRSAQGQRRMQNPGDHPGQNPSPDHRRPPGNGGNTQGHGRFQSPHEQPGQFGSEGSRGQITNASQEHGRLTRPVEQTGQFGSESCGAYGNTGGLREHPKDSEREGWRREQGSPKCDGQTEHMIEGYRSQGHCEVGERADQQRIKGLPDYSSRRTPPSYPSGDKSSLSHDFNPSEVSVLLHDTMVLTSNSSGSHLNERRGIDPDSTHNKTVPVVSESHSADSSTATTSGVPGAMPLNNSTEICDWTASIQRRQQTEVKRKLSDPITEKTCAMENTFHPETATIHSNNAEKGECEPFLTKWNSNQ